MSKTPIEYVTEIRKLIKACYEDTGVMVTGMEVSWMSDSVTVRHTMETHTIHTLVDVEVYSKVVAAPGQK